MPPSTASWLSIDNVDGTTSPTMAHVSSDVDKYEKASDEADGTPNIVRCVPESVAAVYRKHGVFYFEDGNFTIAVRDFE